MTIDQAIAYIASVAQLPDTVDPETLRLAVATLNAAAAAQGLSRTDPEAQWLNVGIELARKLGISGQSVGAIPDPEATPDSGELTAGLSAVGAGAGNLLSGLTPPPAPEEEVNRPQPIGVSKDFVPPPQNFNPPVGLNGIPEPGVFAPTPRPTDPYVLDDSYSPQAWTTVRIQTFQNLLVRAGLLEEGDFYLGFWDDTSANALATAMGYANRSGSNVQTVIDTLVALPASSRPGGDTQKEARRFVSKADPATMAQDVKRTFRSRLGREPSADELNSMAKELGALTDAGLAQQNYLAGNITPPTLNLEGTPPTPVGPIQQVDPTSRFLELFDAKYGNEVARNQRVVDTESQRRAVMSSLTTMQSLIG